MLVFGRCSIRLEYRWLSRAGRNAIIGIFNYRSRVSRCRVMHSSLGNYKE